MYDICCLGHITLDKVVTPHNTVHMPGGTAFYFSHAIRQMDINYLLVTALAETEMDSVYRLQSAGIHVEVLPSRHTVYFENIYGDNPDQRAQRVLQEADPFLAGQLGHIQAKIYHLGPLLAGDFDIETIRSLAAKGTVSLDAQGYLRKVEDQKVLAVDWAGKLEALQYVSILKVNDHELEALTGQRDIRTGARILAGWGVNEVVITLGSLGSLIYADGIFYSIAAYKPALLADATGCGDTYMAGYLARRIKGDGIQQAGEFASAMAGLKIEKAGPFTGTQSDVDAAKDLLRIDLAG